MAIKRAKATEPEKTLPAEFLDRTKKAFSLQTISGKYEEAFKAEKEWITAFLEESDELQVDLGKGIRTPEGLVCYKSRENWKIDVAEIERMVKEGELSLATVLAISSINAKKLKDSIGETRFNKIAVNTPTEHLAMTATPEFKAEIDRVFELRANPPVTPETPASPAMTELTETPKKKFERKPAAAPAGSVKDSLAKALAAEAKVKTSVAPDADLEAILREGKL